MKRFEGERRHAIRAGMRTRPNDHGPLADMRPPTADVVMAAIRINVRGPQITVMDLLKLNDLFHEMRMRSPREERLKLLAMLAPYFRVHDDWETYGRAWLCGYLFL